MKNRMLSLLLCAAMLLTAVPAAAADSGSEARAAALYSLGLFRGTGLKADGTPEFQLDGEPTRLQALIMLVRLLGQDAQALNTQAVNPFYDVNETHDAYGIPYVAHAYANGLTQGQSATSFDPDAPLTAQVYATFLLRALGYDDRAGDFSWVQALPFAVSVSLMSAETAQEMSQRSLTRGDMVELSYAALLCSMKGGEKTLAQHLRDQGVFSQEAGELAGVLPSPAGEPVTYYTAKIGALTAHVISVKMSDPRVRVRSALVDGTLGHTAAFSDIVAASGCLAAVNGNFFEAYKDFKRPIGHVMVDGTFLYGNSGLSSLGITADGKAYMGRLPVFLRITASNGYTWAAYEVNTVDGQGPDASVLYLPSYGQPVTITSPGSVMIASNGVFTEYRAVAPGDVVEIPAGGLVLFAGPNYMAEAWNHEPVLGSAVTGMEPYLFLPTEDSFPIENVVSILSGGPRLVTKGAMETMVEDSFNDPSRFGPKVAAPRTAAGVQADGTLLLVAVPGGATIQQMRELMLALNCWDAVNLDGGASCAMYYDGKTVVTPGRQLTVTLQVFVDP